ncbi:UNVERIFIED_CONTAM: hypothetical protein HDU68_010495 [Siphonaria sp. JEL0065]|nr:hypothetical protein HDU68_010495 [Siphonaria sp. JEL0065]
MQFNVLPSELIDEIVSHLPINSNLYFIGLASKSFGSVIFGNDLSSACFHLRALRRRRCQNETLWDFLHSFDLSNKKAFATYSKQLNHSLDAMARTMESLECSSEWIRLPINYKTVIYGELLKEPEWDGVISREQWIEALEEVDSMRRLRINPEESVMESDSNPSRPVYWSLSSDQALVVMTKLLLENDGFDCACNNNRPLRWATRNNQVDVVRLLLQSGNLAVNPLAVPLSHLLVKSTTAVTCASGEYPTNAFQIAVKWGFHEIVNILMDDKRITHDDQLWAHEIAMLYGRYSVMQVLLKRSSVDPWIGDIKDAEVFHLLLNDSRIHASPEEKHRAFFFGVCNGHVPLTKQLIGDPDLFILPDMATWKL